MGKTTILAPLFFLCAFFSIGQIDSLGIDEHEEYGFIRGWTSMNTVLGWEGGVNAYDLQALNNQFLDNYGLAFPKQNGTIGVTFSLSTIVNNKLGLDQHFDFQYAWPSSIEIGDSLKYVLAGFYFGLDICKDAFPKTKVFDFLFGVGFNTGRMTVLRKDVNISEDYRKYKNPFFAPKITIEPRVRLFRRISLSIRGEIQYDVTRSLWKRKQDSLEPIEGAKASGYNLHLTLGWNY